jgi:hypothetical protein
MVSLGAVVSFGATMGAAQSGAQAAVARSYDLSGFEEVSVVGPHRVVISVGPGYSVRAEGPQRTLDDTEVEIEDGHLWIHPIDDDRWDRRDHDYWRNYEPATFHVTLPRLAGVSLVGGSRMSVDRVEGDRFSASVAGSGDLDVAALRVDDARFSIAGSGDLVARGSARRSRVSIAGSGNLRAREVRSTEAAISIAGSGNAALTVDDDARISIVGSGDVDIAGPARCSVSRLGSGRVRCGGADVAG